MIRVRSPERRALSRTGALAMLSAASLPFALLPLSPAPAHADAAGDQAQVCEEGSIVACDCEQDASCWDFSFLSSGKSTLLGLTTALSAVTASDDDSVDVALLASYRADVYRASGLLNGHVSASGAIGAGSAGNQGAIAGAIDFGARLPTSPASGPMLRIGPNGWVIGNDALELSFLEPLRLSFGFQHLVGDHVLEAGLTTGLLGSGHFTAEQRSASLTGSLALGHYVAAHFAAFRFDGRVIYVRPSPFGAAVRLGIVQLEACAQAQSIAFCFDLRYLQSRLPSPLEFADRAGAELDTARGLLVGLTLGLTP